MGWQARPPNQPQALAGVVTGRHAAHGHPRPRTRTSGEGPRCIGHWPHAGAVQGAAGQTALQPGAGELRPQVRTASADEGGHRAHKMFLCADKFYTSEAMMEHLASTRCTTPPGQKTGKRPPTSSRAGHGSPHGTLPRPNAPPPRAGAQQRGGPRARGGLDDAPP